jgi:hypothetical protein
MHYDRILDRDVAVATGFTVIASQARLRRLTLYVSPCLVLTRQGVTAGAVRCRKLSEWIARSLPSITRNE